MEDENTSIWNIPENKRQIYWQKRWQNSDTKLHLSLAHPDLVKHEDKLLKENCRVLLPLCGKSVDLIYLAHKGHEVVGCDFSDAAIMQFFEEQAIEYSRSQHPTAPFEIFTSTDKNISIYKGDFFELNSFIVGKFDAVWDRDAFVAVSPSRRSQYADVLDDVIKEDGKYLLFSVEYEGYNPITPFCVTAQDLDDVFGRKFCFSVLETYETRELPFLNKHGLPEANISLILFDKRQRVGL